MSTINPSIIISNILGATFALIISLLVSRWEFNRQAQNKRKNWYRNVHNTVVRVYGSREIDYRVISENKMEEYSRLYEAYSQNLESHLSEAPTDEVDMTLFNSLQNIQLSMMRYGIEVDNPEVSRSSLQHKMDVAIDFCQIALYIIEQEKSTDVELLTELDGDDLEEAKEKYEKFTNGDLYKEKNQEAREKLEKFEKLVSKG